MFVHWMNFDLPNFLNFCFFFFKKKKKKSLKNIMSNINHDQCNGEFGYNPNKAYSGCIVCPRFDHDPPCLTNYQCLQCENFVCTTCGDYCGGEYCDGFYCNRCVCEHLLEKTN